MSPVEEKTEGSTRRITEANLIMSSGSRAERGCMEWRNPVLEALNVGIRQLPSPAVQAAV